LGLIEESKGRPPDLTRRRQEAVAGQAIDVAEVAGAAPAANLDFAEAAQRSHGHRVEMVSFHLNRLLAGVAGGALLDPMPGFAKQNLRQPVAGRSL